MTTAVTFKKLPSVVALTRSLVMTDALFYSALANGQEKPLPVLRHGIRGTQNVDKEGKTNAAGTVERREVANIQVTDSAKADPEAVALIARFGFRPIKLGSIPFMVAAGKEDKDAEQELPAFRRSLEQFVQRALAADALDEIGRRFARNMAGGRWLWRNRMVAAGVEVTVQHGQQRLQFNALTLPLQHFQQPTIDEQTLGTWIADGLRGSADVGLQIEARVDMGVTGSFEVYPSQNYLEDKRKGFARSLYCLGHPEQHDKSAVRVMGQAAIRDQKIGNALRTFDTWYPSYAEVGRAIAVEPNGASLEAQDFYRPASKPCSAFKLMCRLNELDPRSDDGLFMLACLIRGGVYSGGN